MAEGKINDTFEKEIVRAACDNLRRDGFKAGFSAGMHVASDEFDAAFVNASTVTKVVFNGVMTIVYFADGAHEIVKYDASYGYAYDREKAVMAATLKHLTGGRYVRALKTFVGVKGDGSDGKAITAADIPAGTVVSSIISQAADCGTYAGDSYELDYDTRVIITADGSKVHTVGDYEAMLEAERDADDAGIIVPIEERSADNHDDIVAMNDFEALSTPEAADIVVPLEDRLNDDYELLREISEMDEDIDFNSEPHFNFD